MVHLVQPASAKPAFEEFKVPAPVNAKKKPEPDDSELPSLYWKPTPAGDATNLDTHIEKQEILEDCVSYLAGQVDGVKLLPSHPKYSSTHVMAYQDTSDLTLNCDKSTRLYEQSLISEPQLSSTREVTCDEADESSIVSKVSTVRNNNQPSQQSSLGRCSTSSNNKHSHVKSNPDSCNQTGHTTGSGGIHSQLGNNNASCSTSTIKSTAKSTAYNPDTWISLFTNTSSLSTPLLMNKVKEHILCIKGTSAINPGAITFGSSGVGESGFEVTATNTGDRTVASPTLKPSSPCPEEVRSSVTPAEQQKPCNQPDDAPRGSMAPLDTSTTHSRASSASRESLPSSRYSEHDMNAGAKEETLSKNALLKCNKSQIFFGTAKIGSKQTGKLIIRNSSYEDSLILDMCIKESPTFRIVESDGELVSNSRAVLEPRQEQIVNLCFQPASVGSSTAKLNIYPRSQSKKVKYSVDLFGYGGSGNVTVKNMSRDRSLQPYFNGKSWSCSLSLENTGRAASFVCVVPVFGKLLKLPFDLLLQLHYFRIAITNRAKQLHFTAGNYDFERRFSEPRQSIRSLLSTEHLLKASDILG